ncbi:HisA/HisF-related TIM barrel protein [Streptomyces sp. NPDC002506]|uniref:HisA/HisF-related TIM barrel protein n=1 Tax=Streptomyces sp. NPDC002506 TaxID=3154536 RepID=UPI00331B9230
MASPTSAFQDRNAHIGDLVIPCIDVAKGAATEPAALPGLRNPSDVVEIAQSYAAGSAQKLFLDVFDPWEAIDYLPGLLNNIKETGMNLLVSVSHGLLPSVRDLGRLLEAGADVVSVSTAMVEDRQTVEAAVTEYGGDRLMGVINSRQVGPGAWEAYIHDGEQRAGTTSQSMAARFASLQVGAILANSIDREGTGQGFDLDLTRTVAEESGLPVIASGGCGSLPHLRDALREGRATYVLVNKMVHNGKHSIAEIRDYLLADSLYRPGS